jgi:RNA polymerase sigma-70 factor (ECF subfamily)
MEAEPEAGLVALVRAGAFEQAATAALDRYGSELYGFLIGELGDSNAPEVYAQTCEDLWKGLPAFGFRCSIRTWLYVLARHATSRFRRSPWQRKRTGDSKLEAVIDHGRSRTAPWQRTEVKDRWRELRESLAPDDRALLVLRVDRDLSWDDCARVTLESDSADDAAIAREAARLRKRFQLLKDDLRTRAKAAGLVDPDR